MKATNWHRRHIEVSREGTIHVSTHYRPLPVTVLLHLDTFVGDAVERVRVELTLDEARKLHGTLGRMIASADQREVEEQAARGGAHWSQTPDGRATLGRQSQEEA